MKELINCRRSLIAIYAITLLFILAYTKGMDTGYSIGSISIGLAGANAYEKKKRNKKDDASSYLGD